MLTKMIIPHTPMEFIKRAQFPRHPETSDSSHTSLLLARAPEM